MREKPRTREEIEYEEALHKALQQWQNGLTMESLDKAHEDRFHPDEIGNEMKEKETPRFAPIRQNNGRYNEANKYNQQQPNNKNSNIDDKTYKNIINGIALQLAETYDIVPERENGYEETLSDFEMLKYIEDMKKQSETKPYEWIKKYLKEDEDAIKLWYSDFLDSSKDFLDDIASAIYSINRIRIRAKDEQSNEIRKIINKYITILIDEHPFSNWFIQDRVNGLKSRGEEAYRQISEAQWRVFINMILKDIIDDANLILSIKHNPNKYIIIYENIIKNILDCLVEYELREIKKYL